MRSAGCLAFIILISLCSVSGAVEPDSFSVRKVHQQLVREVFPSQSTKGDNALSILIMKALQAIVDFFSGISSFILIPLLVIIVLILGYFGIKLYNRFFSGSRMSAKKHTEQYVSPDRIEHDYLMYSKEAFECAQNKHYGDAVVFLHKGSVLFLKMKNIVSAGEYRTNTEIGNDLKEQKDFEEPFISLARAAEQVTFGKTEITEEKFTELAGIYEKNFNDRTN